MRITFEEKAWEDLQHWMQNDKAVLKKLLQLIKDARRSPYEGLGKPEPLRGNYSGWWSRRITGEHRLVYRVVQTGESQILEIAQCRFHY